MCKYLKTCSDICCAPLFYLWLHFQSSDPIFLVDDHEFWSRLKLSIKNPMIFIIWYLNGIFPIKQPFGVYSSRVDIIGKPDTKWGKAISHGCPIYSLLKTHGFPADPPHDTGPRLRRAQAKRTSWNLGHWLSLVIFIKIVIENNYRLS